MTIVSNVEDQAKARYIAESGLRIAAAYVQATATWRDDQAQGAWVSNASYAGGTYSVVGEDGADTDGDYVISQPTEGDGDLGDDSGDLLTLTVTGKYGNAASVVRAVVSPGGALPAPKYHWKLDETTGTTAVDSESGADGTLTNFTYSNSKWTTGQIDGALSFDENNDYIALNSFPNLTGDFTITAWIKPNNTSGDQRIFCDDYNNSSGYAFSLGDESGGNLRLFNRTVNPVSVDSGSVVTSGTWQFVACTHDAAARIRKLYRNSVQVGGDSSAYSGAWGTDSGTASIGGEVDGTSEGVAQWRFGGLMDDVRVYDQVLTDAQLALVATGDTGGGGGGGSTLPVETLTSWTTGTTHTAQLGTNRLLIVMASMEDSYDRTVSTARYGGQNLTQISTVNWGSGINERIYMYYLNETGIQAATSSTIQITWSGSTDDSFISARMYQNVDQSSPIRDNSSAYDNDGSPSTITTSVDVEDGDLIVAVAHSGNTGGYSWNNSFTEGTDQGGSTSQHSTANRAISGVSGSITASASNSNTNRQAIIAATLQAATSSGSGEGGTFAVRWLP